MTSRAIVEDWDGTELALVSTNFQESVNGQWIDITADIDYTVTANEVVRAVLADPNCGRTAGMATITAETVDATLDPFSERARLLLVDKVRWANCFA